MPDRVQYSLVPAWRWLRYHYRRGAGNLPRYLLNRWRWHYVAPRGGLTRFPEHIDLEISSLCDMRCPMCYTTTERYQREVPRQLMDTALFEKLAAEAGREGAYSLRLSLRGEPFLHPDIIAMIRFAKAAGLREVSLLTNGLKLEPGLFARALEAGLDWLTISFDGLDETYNRVRAPAEFSSAVDKIRAYAAIKRQRGARKPVLKIQSVHPAVAGREDEFVSLFAPFADDVTINALADYLDRDAAEDIVCRSGFRCPELYQRLVVGSDGRVLQCANDEYGEVILGDARTQTLREIWHAPVISAARAAHAAGTAVRDYPTCRRCHLPRVQRAVQVTVAGKQHTVGAYTQRVQELGK